jgi:hypothetical protein
MVPESGCIHGPQGRPFELETTCSKARDKKKLLLKQSCGCLEHEAQCAKSVNIFKMANRKQKVEMVENA